MKCWWRIVKVHIRSVIKFLRNNDSKNPWKCLEIFSGLGKSGLGLVQPYKPGIKETKVDQRERLLINHFKKAR